MGVQVRKLDVVPLLAAIAGRHCWAAIAGDSGCTRWRIGRGAVAGCHCWVPLLGCHCWLPLLGGIDGDGEGGCTRWRIGREPQRLAAIDGCHC